MVGLFFHQIVEMNPYFTSLIYGSISAFNYKLHLLSSWVVAESLFHHIRKDYFSELLWILSTGLFTILWEIANSTCEQVLLTTPAKIRLHKWKPYKDFLMETTKFLLLISLLGLCFSWLNENGSYYQEINKCKATDTLKNHSDIQ